MRVNKYLFIHSCSDLEDLEFKMKEVKKIHPQLQILFVVINKKGDPAYGICCQSNG